MKPNFSLPIRRRSFLKSSAVLAAASTLPKWFADELEAKEPKALGPNEKPAFALIGCGGMGRGDANSAKAQGAQIVAICDVDDAQLAATQKMFPDAKPYKDFRKLLERDDIHGVICGTVD